MLFPCDHQAKKLFSIIRIIVLRFQTEVGCVVVRVRESKAIPQPPWVRVGRCGRLEGGVENCVSKARPEPSWVRVRRLGRFEEGNGQIFVGLRQAPSRRG